MFSVGVGSVPPPPPEPAVLLTGRMGRPVRRCAVFESMLAVLLVTLM